MLRVVGSICPFCEVNAAFKAFNSRWPATRGAATLQKRKPSRMTLSPRVNRAPRETTSSGRPAKKSRNSPFGGMNVTSPPRQLEPTRRVSTAEQKRASRGEPQNDRKGQKGQKEPMKALKMQKALSNVSYERRAWVKAELADRDDFGGFDLLPVVRDSIHPQVFAGLTELTPSPIQRLAIPALLGTDEKSKRRARRAAGEESMQQFLLAAETGSGKTLAYVLPVIDAMKRAEALERETELAETKAREQAEEADSKATLFQLPTPEVTATNSATARPKVLILLPTAELVNQVGRVVKLLSHTVKFRSALISSAVSATVIRNRLFSPGGIDVVVSTPHLLTSIAESDPNILSRVSHLVIDEADSLLDRSFSPITSSIIDRTTPSLRQLILCSATIPRALDSFLRKRYPDTIRLATPNLHAIPRRVQLSVVDVDKIPYQGNRDLACAQVIWDIGKEVAEQDDETVKAKKVIVFVNEREKASSLAEYLRSKGIDAHGLSRDSDERKAESLLAAFTSAEGPSKRLTAEAAPISAGEVAENVPQQSRRKLDNTQVLVTTDISSRGIDTTPVKYVVLYDVPHTSIDFIHRLGRVGRMGRRGRGIVLVGKHDRKDVVKEVREGMFRGAALI